MWIVSVAGMQAILDGLIDIRREPGHCGRSITGHRLGWLRL
jgi:hypothetical protein